ncbi:hypothetical protein [Paracoccus sp. Ld10]|uniref:hypothetical protein n=1 Tax=Paracoccus sp. Ld10 TaxID=649158 RepID=UPI0038642448
MKDINYGQNDGFDPSEGLRTLGFTWTAQIDAVQQCAEEAERQLSYVSLCKSEHERKKLGSYYTPTDVADFFWRELFVQKEIFTNRDALSFLRKHHFVEPAAGAGALIFALMKRFVALGLTPDQLAELELSIVDINANALSFVEEQIESLAKNWNVVFDRVHLVRNNFLELRLDNGTKPYFFFGNPPFVGNKKELSPWKNLYADFLEKALQHIEGVGGVHFILPLSIAFSRDYNALRTAILKVGGTVCLSNFDNIPDTLFKSGKPSHTNTNKANSQRCTILTILPEGPRRVLATRLLRWSKKDRATLLGRSPEYFDVSGYAFDKQIPRPDSQAILDYLNLAADSPRLGTILAKSGRHELFVAGVARNYISLREGPANGVHALGFKSEEDFLLGLGILSSDLFLSYWLSLGDGFHLTKGNIFNFPLHHTLVRECEYNASALRKAWQARQRFQKGKLNSGQMTRSFDLTNAVPSLIGA